MLRVHARVAGDLLPLPLPVVCAVIERDGRVLLAQRPAAKHLGGLWELPGGKIEAHETPGEALAREIREELGCALVVTGDLGVFVHCYDSVTIALHALIAQLRDPAQDPQPVEHEKIAWVLPHELTHRPLAPADLPVVDAYRRSLAACGRW